MPKASTQSGSGVVAVVKATLARGGENQLGLYAQAMAYAFVTALAPLTIALSWLGGKFLSRAATLPPSPLGTSRVPAAAAFGPVLKLIGPLAPLVVAVLVIFGISSLFGLVSSAVQCIWRQPERGAGTRAFLREHLLAMLLVVTAGLALLVSSAAGNALAGAAGMLAAAARHFGLNVGWLDILAGSRFVLDFAFSAMLLEAVSLIVPRSRPRASDVLTGALLTAFAYAAGQLALGTYLAASPRLSALGAFGAFLGFLVWAYYTALIVLWGLQLTHEIAQEKACRRGGESMKPYSCTAPNTGR